LREEGKVMPLETQARLFQLSLGMASAYGPKEDLEIIRETKDFWGQSNARDFIIPREVVCGAKPSVTLSYNKIFRFLYGTYKINSPESLVQSLEYFSSGGTERVKFDRNRRELASMTYAEKQMLAQKLVNRNDSTITGLLPLQYDRRLPEAGILAYGISNYVSICRLGFMEGYLGEKNVYELTSVVAKAAQNAYSGFEEFGLAATVGLLYASGENYRSSYAGYSANLVCALNHPLSYWRHLRWDTPL
jgi:hypothetical protein